MSVQKLAKLAVRVALVGSVGLALVAPSADARPVTDVPMYATAPARQPRELLRDDLVPAGGDVATSQTPADHTSGGFDWATAAIGGVSIVCVVGLIWLSAAAIGRVTRTRVAS